MSRELIVSDQVAGVELQATLEDVACQLAPTSARVYRLDAKIFAGWMQEQGLTPITMTRRDVIAFRAYLVSFYPKVPANRIFSAARRLLDEQIRNARLAANPFADVKGSDALGAVHQNGAADHAAVTHHSEQPAEKRPRQATKRAPAPQAANMRGKGHRAAKMVSRRMKPRGFLR